MQKILSELIGKRFTVYVNGEYERTTDFIGFLHLLILHTDFMDGNTKERMRYLKGCTFSDGTFGYVVNGAISVGAKK